MGASTALDEGNGMTPWPPCAGGQTERLEMTEKECSLTGRGYLGLSSVILAESQDAPCGCFLIQSAYEVAHLAQAKNMPYAHD